MILWKMRFIALFLLVASAEQVSGTPIQWKTEDGGNGHYYDAVIGLTTWPDAKTAAEGQSFLGAQGHLVTISDADENDFVNTTFSAQISTDLDGLWAGFTDQVIEGEWRWIDDTPGIWQDPDNFASPIQTAFTGWLTGPNDFGGEDFLVITALGWNDYLSNASRAGYLIEWDPAPVPEPSTYVMAVIGLVSIGICGWRQRTRRTRCRTGASAPFTTMGCHRKTAWSKAPLLSIVVIAICMKGQPANALLVSDFTGGTHTGWEKVLPFNGTLNAQATGGNPGGFMYSTDTAAGGGWLLVRYVSETFDLTNFARMQWDEYLYNHGSVSYRSSIPLLFGSDGTRYEHRPSLGPLSTWNTRSVAFDESLWELGPGSMSFAQVLQGAQLGFVMDTSTAASGREVGIDNVILVEAPVPEPSTYALASIGLIALGFYGWRRKRNL